MTSKQYNVFTALQERWTRHQELRSKGAPIAELAASRRGLDSARLAASRSITL